MQFISKRNAAKRFMLQSVLYIAKMLLTLRRERATIRTHAIPIYNL